MKSLHRLLAMALSGAFFIACNPAGAQWQVPTNHIPLGKGAGTGFGSVPFPSLSPASVKVYGATGSGFSTTGTISAGSRTLTLASAIDFKNGNGILVQAAGAATSVGSPTLTAVAAINTTGATTYAYKIASKSNSGGLKAATAATTIANGHATLGTYGAGTAGIAMNQITWTNGSGSPLCTAVWRSKSGGAYQLLGCFTGTSIFDSGLPARSLFGLPATPPASDVADDLVTTVSSGGGTTTLTLAATATTAATATGITHEDTAAINAAAAANTSLYFPPGTYIVRGLQLPSTLNTVKGDGAGLSNIFSIAQTTDGFKAAVSSSMNGGKFYMSGMKIEAAIPMAYNGFVLHFAYTAGVYDSEFVGRDALYAVFGKDVVLSGNQITGWWNAAIHDSTNDGSKIERNVVHPISGQAGAVALSGTPAGSDYVWGAGILSEGGSLGYHHISNNTITMIGGAFGIASNSVDPVIENNVIRHSGRECIVPGSVYLTSKAKITGNYCYWAEAGNGNLSSYDFGMSISDDNTHVNSNVSISDNTFINSAWGSIAVYGGSGSNTLLDVAVTDNKIFGSNQISNVNNCGIEISGSSTSKVRVANNVFGALSGNMTYNVCEQDNGTGLPSNNTVSLNLGPSGTSGYVNLPGSGSISYLLPSHTGQLATLAGVETLTNKTLITPSLSFGSGASSNIIADSTNTGFENSFIVRNAGTASNASTVATSTVTLGGTAFVQMAMSGGATPTASISNGSGATGGLGIFANAGSLVLTSPLLTGGVALDPFAYVNAVAPSSPSAGRVTTWADSTDLRFHDKNSAGVIGTTVVADTGASNNFLTAISAAGVISKAQPAFSNISGQFTLAQFPNIATNTVLGNATSGSAVPTALSVASCSTAGSALQWTTNSGFGCNTSITAAAVPVGGITGLGTGVATALAVNVGSAGAPVTFNGALGTPSSGTATNLTGLPISSGVSGLGAGVATFLATPSSANLAAAITDEVSGSNLAFATEGTWTPEITTDGTVGTPAYSMQVGSYERIGRQVTVRFAITLSGWAGSPTGNVSISGLPFTATATANDYGTAVIGTYVVAGLAASNVGITGFVSPSSTTITLRSSGNTGASQITVSQLGTSGSSLIGVAHYRL